MTTQLDDLTRCLIADGTMIAPMIAGQSAPMIASLVNARDLAVAANEMLARIAVGGGWSGAERGGIADAMLALSCAKLAIMDTLEYGDEDEDE